MQPNPLRATLVCLATLLASACNAATSPAPSGVMHLTTAEYPNLTPAYSSPFRSRIAATSNSKLFEYINNDYGSYSNVYDYPKGDAPIDTIKNVGGQSCTNVLYGYGKKTFWIVASSVKIAEFSVPKTLVRKLSTSLERPSSCAMNLNGDLAVGDLYSGDVAIYKNAKGTPTVMTTPLGLEYFDGYDPKGDLFFDGLNIIQTFELDELPAGSTTIQKITLSQGVNFPGSVQWDGKYMTVYDQEADVIYRFQMNGTNGTLKGTVKLTGAKDCAQTWIAKGLVFCADAGTDAAEVFKYPAGGSPVAVFTGNFDLPLGTVAVEK
jgi:hypothetical protein